MPSLLSKYKKRRESHKADDGSSVTSHEADQRSPSGSSVRSADTSLDGATAAGFAAVPGPSQFAQHLPQQAQQGAQQAQQAGQKVLHSPFLGQHSPQGAANQQNAGSNEQPLNGNGGPLPGQQNRGPGSTTSPSVPAVQGNVQGGHFSGPSQGPGSRNGAPGSLGGQNGPNLHPSAPTHQREPPMGAHLGPQHANPHAEQHHMGQHAHLHASQQPNFAGQQGRSPVSGPINSASSPMSPPPHGQAPLVHNRGTNASSPQSPGNNAAAGAHGLGSGSGADSAHERDRKFQQRYRQSPHEAYKSPLSEPSETPWAEYAIQRACPSPRFGHSANYIAARDGELFIMGGIRDSDILSDLWVIDTNMLTGYQLVTEGAKVGARVGHSSLVLGNAHVMFGGDTKIEETDPLDDNLYLLNTSSLKWTVAQPVGPRPTGRYGHSLSNVGARIYVFGGQVDEQFYNDMWSFDLQSWRSASARWELVQPASNPPTPRTNHTVVTWNDKLYLFGGANGDLWYSDTWCFDPVTRRWDQLDCTGYVPAPCQGHAATIIGDVMYVFGGMSSQGVLIDQLFALKLTTLKWYTFQNLGPGPSPRSGHSLTAFTNDKILVWGGTDQGNSAYVLDVSRINYPDDNADSTAQNDLPHDAPAVVPPARPTDSDIESRDVAAEMSPQPRLQGLDNSGPTQGRANPAARNSMLFAKRRSVIAPSSPLRDARASEGEQLNTPLRGAQDQSSLRGSAAAESDSRTPNRTHVTPASYISETEGSSDERFVSAVDLNENQGTSSALAQQLEGAGNQDQRRPRGHTRGKSLGGAPLGGAIEESLPEPSSADVSRNNTLTRADVDGPKTESQSDDFQKMESELGGMPGGLPQKPVSAFDKPEASFDGARSEDSLSSIPRELNDNDGDDLAARTPGLRRSQPQTNLALRNLDDENAEKDPLSTHSDSRGNDNDESHTSSEKEHTLAGVGAVGAAGAGLIGLSDQMNLPPDSHAAQSQQMPASKAVDDVDGLSVGTPRAEQQPTKDERPAESVPKGTDSSGDFDHVETDRLPTLNKSPIKNDLGDYSGSSFHSNGPAAEYTSHGLRSGGDIKSAGSPPPVVTIPSQSMERQHARTPSRLSTETKNISQNATSSTPVATDPKSQSSPKGDLAAPVPTSHLSETPRQLDNNDDALLVASPSTSASVTAELAKLRQELNAYRQRDLDGEHHKLKESHAASERELLNLRDSHGQLQGETSKLRNEHEDLQQRYAHVQKLMNGHVSTLQAQQEALYAANAKLEAQQQELSRLPILERENADLKHQLQTSESARKHAEEQLQTLTGTHEELKSAHADLTDKHSQLSAAGAGDRGLAAAGSPGVDAQVNQLVQLWAEYNNGRGANVDANARDIPSDPSEDYRSLYETHRTAAESAQRDLELAYSEQAKLKAQLRELNALQSSAPSTADLELLKEQHQAALSQLDKQHQEALVRAKSESRHDSEDLRARLHRLEAQYEELNAEYQKAVDLSRNQQNALARTREELNHSRAHAQRLEEQLEDASIHVSQANDTGDVSTHSVGSARNDQAALVIRDLRTQIVILEEEMQGQREQIMKLKKAALTTAHH